MSAITGVPPSPATDAGFAGWPDAAAALRAEAASAGPGLSSAPFAAGLRLLAILAWTLPLALGQAALLAVRARQAARRLARLYWQGVGRILGLRVIVRGRPPVAAPVLFVANHISYLDIVVLGTTVEAGFVAKGEIASWPVFSTLARLGRTVFVDRARRHRSGAQRDAIRSRLAHERESLILFPEGTSHDGNRVRPFKTALFAAAFPGPGESGPEIPVQPVSLAYTGLDGMPLGRGWRSLIAWYGDMGMADHAWRLLGLGRVTAELVFHDPVQPSAQGSRKELAAACHATVAAGVARANGGWR